MYAVPVYTVPAADKHIRKRAVSGPTSSGIRESLSLIPAVGLTIVLTVVLLVVGLYIVDMINSTIPVKLNIDTKNIISLLLVALIVAVAALIIYVLSRSLGGGLGI